jgi:hypothetical protein
MPVTSADEPIFYSEKPLSHDLAVIFFHLIFILIIIAQHKTAINRSGLRATLTGPEHWWVSHDSPFTKTAF